MIWLKTAQTCLFEYFIPASSMLIQASENAKDIEFTDFFFFLLIYVGGLFLGLYTLVKNEQKLSDLNFLSLKAVKQLNSWLLGT